MNALFKTLCAEHKYSAQFWLKSKILHQHVKIKQASKGDWFGLIEQASKGDWFELISTKFKE